MIFLPSASARSLAACCESICARRASAISERFDGILTVLSDCAKLVHRREVVFPNDHVIEQWDFEQFSGLRQYPRYLEILGAGCRIAARMIVYRNDRGAALAYRFFEKLLDAYHRRRYCPDMDGVILDDPILRVQQQRAKMLLSFAHQMREVSLDIFWALYCGDQSASSLNGSPAKLEDRIQALQRESVHACEFVENSRRRARQSANSSSMLQQFSGFRNRVVRVSVVGCDPDCQQLDRRHRRRAKISHLSDQLAFHGINFDAWPRTPACRLCAVRFRAAIIGGTGVGERLAAGGSRPIHIPTRFGLVRARSASGLLLLKRHGAGHTDPPHKVNYTAMSEALCQFGIERCFSSAAVGSLRDDWGPGTLCVCRDFVELSGRATARLDKTVEHTDMSNAFDPKLRADLITASKEVSMDVVDGGVYVCTNGPRYESPAEIEAIRRLGGDLVGMTAGTEAIAMREAGIKYACLAIVTNLASGLRSESLSHREVEDMMKARGEQAVRILMIAAYADD